ncbi:MAG: carbohydrate kinase family protein [Anaerovoracaceae bacterium]|jgi:ribokinase
MTVSEILVFGGLMMDRYYMVDRFPERGRDGIVLDSHDFVGGCAINMGVTIKNLGGTPYIVSYVGNDETGKKCLEYLSQMGMPEDCVRQVSGETGYCMVFVEPDGERTFLTKSGLGGDFDHALLEGEVVGKVRVAVVTGYYLLGESGRDVVSALELLKSKGCKILFDPSPMVGYICPGVLAKVMDLANIIIPNWEEGIFLAGKESPLGWAKRKGDRGHKVILTKGSSGGFIFQEGNENRFESVPAAVVDTTGAGDSFAGALAFGMAQCWSLEKSVRVAVRCAAMTTEIKGPHGGFDTSWVKEDAE